MKVGDIVRIRIEPSPTMLVERIAEVRGQRIVYCVWFNEQADCRRDDFSAELLVRCE